MRRWGLYIVLGLTVGLSIWMGQGPHAGQNVVEPVQREPVAQEPVSGAVVQEAVAVTASQSEPQTLVSVPARTSLAWVPEQRAFGVVRWEPTAAAQPPARAVVASVTPAAPSAPPLPFVYIGKLDLDGGRQVHYVLNGDTRYALQAGGVFADVYRFEGIENGYLVIRYQPLDIKQYLAMNP